MKTKRVCPFCKSEEISIYGVKKGFSGGKALVGGVLLGPIGLLAGTAGSNKQETKCLCNNCGQIFDHYQLAVVKEAETPEEEAEAKAFNDQQEENAKKEIKTAFICLGVFIGVLLIIACL